MHAMSDIILHMHLNSGVINTYQEIYYGWWASLSLSTLLLVLFYITYTTLIFSSFKGLTLGLDKW